MPSTASQAGPAAPIPAAVALPSHHLADFDDLPVRIYARAAEWSEPQRVTVHWENFDGKNMARMTPAQARLLAVYLVDCANALDNPAQRVIVDEGEGIGHE